MPINITRCSNNYGPYQVSDKSLIADIALDEDMAGIVLDIFQVFQVAGIGQLIQVDQADILVFFQHIVDKVGANKTGTAGNKISFHLFTIPIIEKVPAGFHR